MLAWESVTQTPIQHQNLGPLGQKQGVLRCGLLIFGDMNPNVTVSAKWGK
jgi:hypothetical protein